MGVPTDFLTFYECKSPATIFPDLEYAREGQIHNVVLLDKNLEVRIQKRFSPLEEIQPVIDPIKT